MTVSQLVLNQLGTESSSPKNRVVLLMGCDDRTPSIQENSFPEYQREDVDDIDVDHLFERDDPTGSETPLVQVGTETSSPKNRTVILMLSENRAPEVYLNVAIDNDEGLGAAAHMLVDQCENAYSDQRMRGGIAG